MQYHAPSDVDADEHFRQYLENYYGEEKQRLEYLVTRGSPEAEVTAARNGLFVLASGLLAFGRLDVVEDVLRNIPSTGGVRRLALGVKAMLPLPEDLDPIRDTELVRAWVQANRTKFKWNEQIGKYLDQGSKS